MEKFHFWMSKAIAYSTFGTRSAEGISASMARFSYSSVCIVRLFLSNVQINLPFLRIIYDLAFAIILDHLPSSLFVH